MPDERDANGLHTVVDERYVRPAISLGWRQASLTPGTEVRSGLERLALQDAGAPISFDWVTDDGADIFTTLLPQSSAAERLSELLEATLRSGVRWPVASIVGGGEAVESMRSVWQRVERRPPHDAVALRTVMTQARADGRTTVTVTGRDPARQYGSASTALAVRMAEHLAQAVLPTAESADASHATMQVVRHLFQATPALSWRLRSPHRRGLTLLESVLDTLTSQHRFGDEDRLALARAELTEGLTEHRRSPVELARAMTRYEVMGWGAELVRDPIMRLGEPSVEGVDAAFAALLRPLAEILGQT